MNRQHRGRSGASRRGGSSQASRRIPIERFLSQRGKRRGWYVVVTLAAALLLMLADRGGLLIEAGDDMARYDGRTFTVTRVIDGDTLDVDVADGDDRTTRIRLWGVDTPEKARRDPPSPAEPFAKEATDLVRRLAEGKRVRLILEPHRLRGKYGRLLAFVELPDGTLLNEVLVSAGLSRSDDRWSHRYIKRFDSLERDAREAGMGLWKKGD
jgi:micrococcal nuclease